MKNKKYVEENEGTERWMVSYADFITLLFAFFVVLYATSNQNIEKEKRFQDSIRQEFNYPTIGGSLNPALLVATVNSGKAIDDISNKEQTKLINNADLEESIEKDLAVLLSENQRKETVTTLRHDTMGVRMSLSAASFFQPGSAKIRREGIQVLDKIAVVLKKTNYRLMVEGHTDDLPVASNSGFESNWELAGSRASQVIRYLIKVQGIAPKRLAAMSYADQRPLVPNISEENRNKNRRIEIMFVTTESPFDDF